MNKNIVIKLIIFILIPFQLLIFTFLVPPFQKPDEQSHFEKSLLISKGYVFCKEKSNNNAKVEKKYVDFIKNPYLDLLTHGKNTKLPLSKFFGDLTSNNQSNLLINFNIDHLCSFPIISYLPQAITLQVLSVFNTNPIRSIYFVRMIMSIIGFLWFLHLFRKIDGDYKLILLFVFALPMTLHQISSFSYDAAHIMLALTLFVLLINYRSIKKISPWLYFKIFFILFLFLSSKKIGYEAFFLLLFLIPFQIKPMIISALIFTPFYFLSKLTGSYDLRSSLINQTINPVHQLNFLLYSPMNIIKVITATTVERLGFYLQSLIGIFGWLEYGLDPLSYFLYGSFFIYVLMNINLSRKQLLSKNKVIFLFIILTISYIFIIILAYVFNTAPGTLTAHGVQGRYFIPFLPFIMLLIIQIKNHPVFQRIIYFSFIVFLILATFFSVFKRYY